MGGGSLGTSSKLNRSGFGISIFSMRPAASILSMIFCFDFACLTRLAYVPADAMNLGNAGAEKDAVRTQGRDPQGRNGGNNIPTADVKNIRTS